MLGTLKQLTVEMRQMPLAAGEAGLHGLRAGIPYELPKMSLPSAIPDQLRYLRDLIADSKLLRSRISETLDPSPAQKSLLTQIPKYMQ